MNIIRIRHLPIYEDDVEYNGITYKVSTIESWNTENKYDTFVSGNLALIIYKHSSDANGKLGHDKIVNNIKDYID